MITFNNDYIFSCPLSWSILVSVDALSQTPFAWSSLTSPFAFNRLTQEGTRTLFVHLAITPIRGLKHNIHQ